MLNRERALTEILRAKADVLLDVSERYPMVDRERSAFTRTAEPSARENTKPTTSAQVQEADALIAEPDKHCPASSSNADVEAHDAMSEAVTISGPIPEAEAGMNNLAPEDNEGEAALDAAEPSAAEVYEKSAGARDVGSADQVAPGRSVWVCLIGFPWLDERAADTRLIPRRPFDPWRPAGAALS